MAHVISGFIARSEGLRKAAVDLVGTRVAPLLLGFGFLPLTEQLTTNDDPAPYEHLERLTMRLATWATRVSATLPLVYVETEYFGGEGWQAAMVWVDGRAAFGPIRTSNLWEDRENVPTPLLDGAINRAVRLIGVERGAVVDEFDALGLGRHKSNKSWLSEAAK